MFVFALRLFIRFIEIFFFLIKQVSTHHYSLHFASLKKMPYTKNLMLLKNYDSCSYEILHIKLT